MSHGIFVFKAQEWRQVGCVQLELLQRKWAGHGLRVILDFGNPRGSVTQEPAAPQNPLRADASVAEIDHIFDKG